MVWAQISGIATIRHVFNLLVVDMTTLFHLTLSCSVQMH